MSLNFSCSWKSHKCFWCKVWYNAWTKHMGKIIFSEKVVFGNAIFKTIKIFACSFQFIFAIGHFAFPFSDMRMFWNSIIYQINVHLVHHNTKEVIRQYINDNRNTCSRSIFIINKLWTMEQQKHLFWDSSYLTILYGYIRPFFKIGTSRI